MTITDLRCDHCGRPLAGPATGEDDRDTVGRGIRFVYHPGSAQLRDDSGLLCLPCWDETVTWMGTDPSLGPAPCPRCNAPPDNEPRLHMSRLHDLRSWQLCRSDAVAFLNRLRTVEPKLDLDTFTLPAPLPDAARED
jgi:hypothetical protein